MPVDQELSALATVASLLPTDIIYLVRDPGGVAEADHKAAVSVLDARYPGAIISVFGRTGAVVAASGDYSAAQISGLGTLAVLNSPLAIANGGSGQITAQAAIDALSNVAAATNEHVLTKDTASGNVIFKAAPATGAPVGATYIVQTLDGTLTNEQALGALATGLLKNANGTGVLSIGVAGTDYPGLAFANVFTVAQMVDGTANAVQFTVQGHSTQTAALQEWQNSSGTVLATMTDGGALNINRDPGSFNAGTYSAFCIGNLAGDAAGNGGLFSIARINAAHKPFVALSGFDEPGIGRVLYFGGGGWGVPDTNEMQFITDPSTSESNNGGVLRLSIASNGDVGIGGIATPAAQLDIKQPSTTGAQPVLRLEQLDVDQHMIQLETTIGTGNAIEAVGAKTLTTTHFIMVKLPGGLTRYIPAGTIA